MEELKELQVTIRGWIALYGIQAIVDRTGLSAHHIRKTYNTNNPNTDHLTKVVNGCRAMDAESEKKITRAVKKVA